MNALQHWNWSLDGWIVLAGALCAMSAALLGNFLVLRKMSMMGDAISHAVLPGLAVAFFLSHSRASLPMFAGAAIVGVLTAVFTEWIRGFGKVDEGASMGVVFTALFALGLIMVVQAADKVDLDPGCVLYGALELTPLNTVTVAGREIPQVVVTLASVFLLNLGFVLVCYKELKISSFDPALATTIGVSARVMHYLLMTLVAITAVASFESVGNILVVAMLIVPAASAHLLTDRLSAMIGVSLLLAALSAVFGHLSALVVPGWFGYRSTNTAGMMAVATGLFFTLALLFAPRHGVVTKLVQQTLLTLTLLAQDVLQFLAARGQQGLPAEATPAELRRRLFSGRMLTQLALWRLRRAGTVERSGSVYRLTEAGRSRLA